MYGSIKGGGLNFFLVINVFYRGSYGLPREAIGPKRSNCSSSGVRTSTNDFSGNIYQLVNFQGTPATPSESAHDPPYNILQFCAKQYCHIANLKFTVILLPVVLDSKLNSNKQNITHNSYLNKVHGIESREGPRNSLAHAACACVVIKDWNLVNNRMPKFSREYIM